MRIVTGILFALSLMCSAALMTLSAHAADDEGKIASIDTEQLTITLDNGNTYKLPGEFDVEALEEGMELILAYDTIAGEKTVTDMQFYE